MNHLSSNSKKLVDKLEIERNILLFTRLDHDNDGLISAEKIDISLLTD